jgi:hypothetical protein
MSKSHYGKFVRIYPESMTSPNLSKGEAVFQDTPLIPLLIDGMFNRNDLCFGWWIPHLVRND